MRMRSHRLIRQFECWGQRGRRTFIVVKRGEKEARTHKQKGSCWEAGKAQREEGNEANAILCRADFLALVEPSITACCSLG